MTQTNDIKLERLMPAPVWLRLQWQDWLWMILVMVMAIYASLRYAPHMDSYELIILNISAVSLVIAGCAWHSFRKLVISAGLLSFIAISLYADTLSNASDIFLLEYLLASQSAIMWMSALFVMATIAYFLFLFSGNTFSGQVATGLTWTAITMGLTGMLVRWWESYLISPDIGHIPVSNLYEVFILFCLITAIIYLHYERRYQARNMGGFVLLVISAAVGFLLWYTFNRGAHEIQPLVPALQSYWMKIHVPANFIGYGCFSISAMLGVAYLLRQTINQRLPGSKLQQRFPDAEMLDDAMYKSIALGFAFFTIATILGALWAAEAWGGYWSWDPKETWALIVWLNYAAWLHMRMSKGWYGNVMAWWSIIGLFVTLFAFLGVNMFLTGLHSYGEL